MPGRKIIDGTFWVFLAEGLAFPLGLIITAFLTRRLGPEGFGYLALAVSFVAWVEWCVSSLFARASIKFVGEARDWRPVARVVVNLSFWAGLGAAALVWITAPLAADLLKEPSLVLYIRLFSLDVPLFSLAHAYRHILVGMGSFRQRAVATAGRWVVKFFLILLFVEMGFSVPGVIWGSIGASFAEFAIGFFYVRLLPFGRSDFPVMKLCAYAGPLFLYGVSMRLYDRLDLFVLKSLGGTASLAGLYGAAQSLCSVPGMLAMSFVPLLLSTLSRLIRSGDEANAKRIAHNAMRFAIALLPFAAMAAGARREIVSLVLGPSFLLSADFFPFLIFGAVALFIIAAATSILTAIGKPGWTFALGGPLVPLAFLGYLFLIPRWGGTGAAFVTAFFAGAGALGAVLTVCHFWKISLPLTTFFRSAAASIIAYTLAAFWPALGAFLILKLFVIAIVIGFSFLWLGELTAAEKGKILSLLPPLLRGFHRSDEASEFP